MTITDDDDAFIRHLASVVIVSCFDVFLYYENSLYLKKHRNTKMFTVTSGAF